MSSLKRVFLLPCAGCHCDIEVVSGQAGGQVACGGCGRRNDVPKLRDLGELRLKADAAARRAGHWGLPQALMMAGLLGLVFGTLGGWWIGAVPRSAIDAAATRANIEAGDDVALYESLLLMERASVERPPLREESELQRRSRFASGMSRTLYGLGGLGAAVALAAGIAQLSSAKRR